MNGAPSNPDNTSSSAAARPVVVDLGKRKRRLIKELRQGGGPLMDEVMETVRQVRAELGEGARAQTPIVILYERRRKKRGGRSLGFPFFMK